MSTAKYEQNLHALKPYLRPNLYEYCDQEARQYKGIVKKNGKVENITIHGQSVYDTKAFVYCKQQLKQFFNEPARINFSPDNLFLDPNRNYADTYCWDFMRMDKHVYREKTGKELAYFDFPQYHFKSAGLIVLGLGSGLFLNELVEKYDFVDLYIIDNNLESLAASLYLCDWQKITQKLEQSQGKIHFIFSDRLEELLSTLPDIFCDQVRSMGLVMGTLVYQHLSNDFWDYFMQLFAQRLSLLSNVNGWLEDELTHGANIISNYARYNMLQPTKNISFFRQNIYIKTDIPIFIIGSGPSFSRYVDIIKKYRDKAIIISGGTAIGVLLANGIKPHFHCELENVPLVATLLQKTADQYDLSGITLLASMTAHPSIIDFFDDVIFFKRTGDAMVATMQGDWSVDPIKGMSATISAVDIATRMGAKNIFFFGLDFAHLDGQTHAKGIVYDDMSESDETDGKRGSAAIDSLVRHPGNLGHDVISNIVWLSMVQHLEAHCQSHQDINWVNASLGAVIGGTQFMGKSKLLPLLDELCQDDNADMYKQQFIDKMSDKYDADFALDAYRELSLYVSDLMNKAFTNLIIDGEKQSFQQWHDVYFTMMDLFNAPENLRQHTLFRHLLSEGSMMIFLRYMSIYLCYLPPEHHPNYFAPMRYMMLHCIFDHCLLINDVLYHLCEKFNYEIHNKNDKFYQSYLIRKPQNATFLAWKEKLTLHMIHRLAKGNYKEFFINILQGNPNQYQHIDDLFDFYHQNLANYNNE